MLYLNPYTKPSCDTIDKDLTLTSVVFECKMLNPIRYTDINLTLTSVVFEFINCVRLKSLYGI